ncbi:MAG TPA: hypothetical protein VGC42_15260 [Kofleriaceae bacterium]
MRTHLLLALPISQLLACTMLDGGIQGHGAQTDDVPDAGASPVTSGGAAQWLPVTNGAPHVDLGTDSAAATSTDSKIHVRSDNPPLLVVFRDGPRAAWQAATQLTPSHYQAEVHGPYQVGVVCETWATMVADRFVVDQIVTWEVARTLDDPRDLVPPCDNQGSYNGLGGDAPAASMIQIGAFAVLADPSGRYITGAEIGTRDIIASNASSILIQRGLPIGFGELPWISRIDPAKGTALAPVRLGVSDIETGETVQAAVHVRTATTDTNQDISVSAPQTADVRAVAYADVKAAVDAVLSAPGDVQSIEVTASRPSAIRALRRPFRLAGNSDFRLPAAVAGGQFAYTAATGEVRASWTALPETSALHLVVSGRTPAQFPFARQELHVSSAYLHAVQPTSAAIDVQLPGYQAAWRVDPAQTSNRTFSAQRVVGDEVAVSAIRETKP